MLKILKKNHAHAKISTVSSLCIGEKICLHSYFRVKTYVCSLTSNAGYHVYCLYVSIFLHMCKALHMR